MRRTPDSKPRSALSRAGAIVVTLGLIVACEDPRPRTFDLEADTIAIGFAGGVAFCPVDESPRTGPTPLYPEPPPCTEVTTQSQSGTWSVLNGALWVAQNTGVDQTDCVGFCNQIRRIDPDTAETESLLPEPRPIQNWYVNGRSIVWSELAEAADAPCLSVETDSDCRVDLWRLDRTTGEASRLTSHGEVYPRRRHLRLDTFGLTGDRVPYVHRVNDARGDDGARCMVFGAPEQTGCVSEVRMIDVATSTATVVVEAAQLNLHPRIAGDFLVWMRGASVSQLALVARHIEGGPIRPLAAQLDGADHELNVEHPWVVWRQDGRLRSHHLERDETHTLSDPDEPTSAVALSAGRVVWGSGTGLITLYNLETRQRRLLLELP